MNQVQDSSQNYLFEENKLLDESQLYENHSISENKKKSVSNFDYDYFQFPADIDKAKLHGDAYRIQKISDPQSQKCECCDFRRIFLKYSIFDDTYFNNQCTPITEYFELIKHYLNQLLIIGTVLIPYSIVYHRLGDRCEKSESCDFNSTKIYSIWNLVENYKSLDDAFYKYLVYITFLILITKHCRTLFNPNVAKKKMITGIVDIIRQMQAIQYKGKIENDKFAKKLGEDFSLSLSFDKKTYENALFDKIETELAGCDNIIQIQKSIIKALEDDQMVRQHIIEWDIYSHYDNSHLDLFQNEGLVVYKKVKIDPQLHNNLFYAILISYYITRVMIAFSIFIRFQFFQHFFTGNNHQILKSLIKCIFGISQILIIKFDDYLAQMKLPQTYMNIHYLLQIIAVTELISCGYFARWFDCFIPSVTTEWMLENEGLVDNMITISYLNIILPPLLSIFDLKYIKKQYKLKKYKDKGFCNFIQIEANKLFERRKFNLNQKRRTIDKIFWLSTSLIFHYPIIIPSSMISLSIIYFVDKYLFVNHSKLSKLNKGQERIKSYGFQFIFLSYYQLIGLGSSFFIYHWYDYLIISILIILTLLLSLSSYGIILKKVVREFYPDNDYIKKFDIQFNSVNFVNGKFQLQKDVLCKVYKNLKKRIKQKRFPKKNLLKRLLFWT